MYLIEGRELLDAHYLMDDRKLLGLSLQTLFFRRFSRFLFLFTFLHILGVKKHTLFNKFLSQKRHPIYQEERDAGYEGNMYICLLYVVSLTYIVHCIALHSTHMQWWSRLFNKTEILAPSFCFCVVGRYWFSVRNLTFSFVTSAYCFLNSVRWKFFVSRETNRRLQILTSFEGLVT